MGNTMKAFCKAASTILAILLALSLSAVTLAYAQSGFTYEYMRNLLAIALPGGLALFALAFLNRRGGMQEKAQRTQPYPDKELRGKNVLRVVLMILSVVLIVLGIANGGLWDVLVKAINICTECIGLG